MTKVDYLEDMGSRRRFVKVLLTTSFGAMFLSFIYPVLRYLVPPQSGEPRVASVVVPWTGEEIRANSGRIFRFWYACHNGVYDLHGKNVSGPPPRPLDPYTVQVKVGGKIVVARA